jgi:hypothetical protein
MLFSGNKKMLTNMTFRFFGLFVLIAGVCVFNLQAQADKSDKVVFASCESMLNALRTAMIDFQRDAKPDSYLVIIGGAMKDENPSYNSRRIGEAISYIGWAGNIKSDRIVSGVGTPEAEAGYLRLYVNGVLSAEFRTRKNAGLCWGEGNELDFTVKANKRKQ